MAQKGARLPAELQAVAVKLYVTDQLTVAEVAEELQVCTASIYKILDRNGVKRRSLADWAAIRAAQDARDVEELLRKQRNGEVVAHAPVGPRTVLVEGNTTTGDGGGEDVVPPTIHE